MKKKSYLYFAVFFGTIGLIASDTFIPSMTAIAKNFGVTISVIQISITIFMLGFSLARFFISILSDALGRKAMFIFCFSLLFIGSSVCLVAPTEHLFIFGRLLQGIGSGGSNVLARVIIRDLTENKHLAKYNSLYSMYAISFMVMAPFVGSLLQTYFNWHAAFIFIAVLSLIALIISALIFKETNSYKALAIIHFSAIKNNFIRLFNAPNWIQHASLLFASFGFMTAWLTSGSVLLQEKMHLTYMEFGYCALFVGLFYFIASWLSSKYVSEFGEMHLIAWGVRLLVLPLLILPLGLLSTDIHIGVASLVLSVAVGFFASGFIIPNSYSLGVKSFVEIAGMAGAFFGFSQMFGASVYSFAISCLSSYSLLPLFTTMLATFIICNLSLWRLGYKRRKWEVLKKMD